MKYAFDCIGIGLLAFTAGFLVSPPQERTPPTCIQVDEKALSTLKNGNDIEKSSTSKAGNTLIFLLRSQK
jgi:hypothetical protein